MQFLNISFFFPLPVAATATEKTATMTTHENSELNVFENTKVLVKYLLVDQIIYLE